MLRCSRFHPLRIMLSHFLRRGVFIGLFCASTLLFFYSWSLMRRADLDKSINHLGAPRTKLNDLTYEQYTTTRATEVKTRPYAGYYGDGYNIRKLPWDLFRLAPEVFDGIPTAFLPEYKNPCFYYRGSSPPGLRCLPYFYLIGMQKCGSTDLWEKINMHGEIQRTEKEPHWWARYRVRELPPDYANMNVSAPLSLSWYLDAMSYQIVQRLEYTHHAASWLVIGDGSTSTLWDNQWQTITQDQYDGPEYIIADVMREVQPKAKFIVVLRDPTSRVYSDYLFFGNDGDNFVSKRHFHGIVKGGIEAFNECTRNRTERACTLHHGTHFARLLLGNYAVFLRDWVRVFPRDQIKVIRLEDWKENCVSVLRDIFAFLELSPLDTTNVASICQGERERVNSQMRKHMGDMLPITRTLLDNFYRPMNLQLSAMLNDTRFLWKDKEPMSMKHAMFAST